MNKNLLILGAGQYGQVAKEIAESMGCFEKIDFLDDKNEIAIDRLDNYEKYTVDYSYAVVAIGDPDVRLAYIKKLEEACYRVAILVSPKAYISSSAQLIKGTIVEPMAVVNAYATLCIGVFACAGSIVNHNAFVGDACQLDCGSVVGASAALLAKTKLHYNEVYYGMGTAISMKCPEVNDYKFEDGM